MKLTDVFEKGHKIACSRDRARFVVLAQANPETPQGYYEVTRQTVEAAATLRVVEADHLGRRLGIQDLMQNVQWFPAVDHCWCEQCADTRQFRSTQAD